jgi:hypothetical protein
MLGETDDVLADNIGNDRALLGSTVLKDVLNDKVAILVPAERACIDENFIDQALCLTWVAVLR